MADIASSTVPHGPGTQDGDGGDELAIGEAVRELLARAPEWIRQDLASKDAQGRARAEETLAAMITAALVDKRTRGVLAA